MKKTIFYKFFEEPYSMLFYGCKCSMDCTIRHTTHVLKGVESLANHRLSTSASDHSRGAQ